MRRDPRLPYRLIISMPAVVGQPPAGLLTDPAFEANDETGIRRSPRDWAVDGLLFSLAVGFTVLTLVDGVDRLAGSSTAGASSHNRYQC